MDKNKTKSIVEDNLVLSLFTLMYGITYMYLFGLLENRVVLSNIIHTWVDDIIPFCEYFVIPYFFWFIYMIGTVLYFLFICKNKSESRKMIYSLILGSALFLIVSFIYPNEHMLRPTLIADNLCLRLVEMLYQIDTATNILPSMHTFGTVVASIALLNQKELRDNKKFVWFVWVNTVLIVLSTVCLKQHSVIDVVTALLLNFVCYCLMYKQKKTKEKNEKK